MSKKPIIVIDPGHGGRDSGAVNGVTGSQEKDIVFSEAKALRFALKQRGVDARLTREDDRFLTLGDRAAIANELGAPLISLHCNASNGDGHGFEAFTSPGQTKSDALATSMLDAYAEAFSMKSRYDFRDGDADKEAKFAVLVRTIGVSVLFELGFIDNPADEKFLVDLNMRVQRAEVLADAIVSWLVETTGFKPVSKEAVQKEPAKMVAKSDRTDGADKTDAIKDLQALLFDKVETIQDLEKKLDAAEGKLETIRKALG